MVGKHGTTSERLDRHSIPEPNSGCWLWFGSINKFGYGQIMMPGGIPRRAHRVSYQVHKGKIPKGLDVRHTCDLRCCINPDHLITGTRKQNMDDCARRGRTARGFSLPHTKLSPQQVATIIADDRKHKDIAKSYDIGTPYVSMLKSGKRR